MSIQSNDSNNAERHEVAAKVDELLGANHCTPNPGAYICPAHPAEFIQCNVPVFRVKCSELSLRDAPIRVRGDLQQLRGMAGYDGTSSILGVQIRIEVNVNCNDNPFVLELPEAVIFLHTSKIIVFNSEFSFNIVNNNCLSVTSFSAFISLLPSLFCK